MQRLLSCLTAFKENCRIRLVDVRIMSIMENIVSSNRLATSSCPTDTHYMKVIKMMLKQQGVQPLLLKHGKEVQLTNNVDTTYLDDPG